MSRTLAHPRRVLTIGASLVLAVAVALVTFFAVHSNGYASTSATLYPQSVWVTNQGQLLVGRLNRQIDELDSAALTDSSGFDVLQDDSTVLVTDSSRHTLRALNTASVSFGAALALPTRASVAMGGGVLAVADQATGKVWTRPAAGISGGTLADGPATTTAGPGAVVAVSGAGVAAVAAPGQSTIATVAATGAVGTQDLPAAPSKPTVAVPDPVQIAFVGTVPVVLDRSANRILLPGKSFPLPDGTSGAVLQQTGPAADGVLVATDRALLQVSLADGSVSTFDAGTTGTPAAPVWLNGCANGAWGGSAPTYLSWCGSTPTVQPIPSDSGSGALTFRVNHDVVVLNDLATGNVWVLDHTMTLVNNWGVVTPPKQQDAKSNPNGDQAQSNQLTLSRTDCSGGVAPPKAEPDTFGVPAGHPSVLPVLANDVTSDCAMVVITKVTGWDASVGSVAIVDGGQQIQVTPKAADTGRLPELTYTIDDGQGHQASTTVSISVVSDTLPPKKIRDSATVVAVGGTVTHNVLADWMSPSGDPLFLTGASISGSTDTVSYTPDGNITVNDSGAAGATKLVVTFVVSDGVHSATGRMTVDVISEDKATPVASPVYAAGVVGEPVTVYPLRSVVSPSTQPLRLAAVTPAPGTTSVAVTMDATTGTVTLTGAKPGTVYLSYQVAAGAASAKGVIRFDVTAPPAAEAAPIAMSDVAYLPVGGSVRLDLTANDIDPAGGVLAVQQLAVDPSSGLVVTLSDMHLVSITSRRALPAGGVWFSYSVSDGGPSATGWVHVIPVPPSSKPTPPIAGPITVSVRAGDAVTVPIADHAADPSGELLTVQPFPAGAVPAAQGLLFASDADIRFLAAAARSDSTVRTTYTVVDTDGLSGSAPLVIHIVGSGTANHPPAPPAVATARVFVGATVDIPLPLAGLDPDGDWVMPTAITVPPKFGQASIVGADTVRYKAFNTPGTDSFSYTVADPYGATSTGTVRVVVVPVPVSAQPPVAPDLTVSIAPGRSIGLDVLAQVSDPSGSAVRFAKDGVSVPASVGGALQASIKDSVLVLKAGTKPQVVPVSYSVVNAQGLSATGVVTVTISADAPRIPPTASDIFVTSAMLNPARTAAVIDVSASVTNPGGLASELTLSVPGISAAQLKVTGNRQLTVALSEHRQVLAYRVTNRDGLAADAFVIVPPRADLAPQSQLNPQQNKPKPEPFRPSVAPLVVDAGTTVSIPVADHVSGAAAGRSVTIAAGTLSASVGTLTKVDSRTLRWQIPDTAGGPAALTVPVTDGASDPVTVSIPATIRPKVVPPPVFASAPLSVPAGSSATLDLAPLVTTTDAKQAASLRFSGPTGASGGVTGSLSGSVLTVRAAESARRGSTVPLSVTVADSSGHTVSATITVTVTSVNAPLATVPNVTVTGAQGKTSAVNVLAGASNPLSGPLTVVSAALSSGQAQVSFTADGTVSITPGDSYLGAVTVTVTVADASKDPTRQVQARITVQVLGKPDAPSTPKVVSVGDRTATLEWVAPAAHGSLITGYTVAASGFTQQCAASPCVLTGLTNNTSYTFTVTATNAVGASPASGPSAPVRPDVAPDAPAQPALTFGDGTVTATWKTAASKGSPVDNYLVQISPAPANGSDVISTPTNTATFGGLVNGTSYQVTVVAQNKSGTDSDPSPAATMIPATVPDTPAAPGLAADTANSAVDVTWNPVAGNGDDQITYTVAWKGSDGSSGTLTAGPGAKTAAAITPAVLGVTYSATVAAKNKAGSSPAGPAGTVTPYTAPGAPTGLTATATGTDNQVALSWTAPGNTGGGITGYQYQIGGGGWTDIGSTDTTFTVTDATNLPDGADAALAVRACNDKAANACGPASDTAGANPYGPPGSTQGFTVTATGTSGQITLSWTAPDSNGRPIAGYQLAQDTVVSDIGSTATSLTINGLTNGQKYNFQVRAYHVVDGTKTVGGWTPTTVGIPYAPVPAVGNLRVTGNSTTGVSFAWAAPSGNGLSPYTYRVNGSGQSGTSATVGGACSINGSGVSISVVAVDSQGHTGPAASLSGTTTPCYPTGTVSAAGAPTFASLSNLTPDGNLGANGSAQVSCWDPRSLITSDGGDGWFHLASGPYNGQWTAVNNFNNWQALRNSVPKC